MFSFTAPRMDDQQVKDERQNMCEEERMAIYRDLYGKEEDETFLTEQEEDTLLEKLQEELDAIKVKDAYDLATEKCSDIVLDRSFRLQFLAADKFDPKVSVGYPSSCCLLWSLRGDCMLLCSLWELTVCKHFLKLAATRMANYWTYKKEIFGTGELFAKKSIEISDLSEKEKKALSQSIFFKLPGTDKHGRLILFSTRQGWVFEKPKEMVSLLPDASFLLSKRVVLTPVQWLSLASILLV